MRNPFKAILDIRRDELPQALLMFGYFLLVITTFWILKPLKKGLFISHLKSIGGITLLGVDFNAPQAELLAKVLNMFVAAIAAIVFSALSVRLRRHQLTTVFGAFFIVCLALYASLMTSPGVLEVFSYYLFGDLYSTLMVTTFFVFLNDITSAESAKRTYGLVVLGGLTGGALGSSVLAGFVEHVGRSTWMWACVGINLVIIGLANLVGRRHERRKPTEGDRASHPEPEPHTVHPATEGARLVWRSRYLLAIVSIVGVYEMASTIADFQVSASVHHYFSGDLIKVQFSRVFAMMNIVALTVQVFLTSFVMRRLGAKIALLVLPVGLGIGSLAFLALPVFAVARILPSLDGGLSYSINQSAKEALYIPTTRREKYAAKAFIDMFLQRTAKAVAVGLSIAMTKLLSDSFEGVRWLSFITLGLIAVWVMAARYAGKHFEDVTTEPYEEPSSSPS